MALRKNQRYLTAGEKTRFINAVLALKEEYPRYGGGLSTYDLFVKWHDDAMAADLAHMGPAFLAWHREYLRRFELALQRRSAGLPGISDGLPFIDDPPPSLRADTPSLGGAGLGLPYWDWSRDRSPRSWPFKTEFLGGDGTKDPRFPPGKVMDGPFAHDGPNRWTLNVFPHDADPKHPSDTSPYLRREIGADHDSSLPTVADVTATLAATPFDSAPWNDMSQSGFRNKLEGFRRDMQKNPPEPLPSQMHNRVHRYIGGTMGPPTSPYDPVFWLHHCYIDKLWADWQRLHPNEPAYLPDGPARKGHNLKDVMGPWNQKAPKDVLNIRELGYHYDTDNYLMANDELYPGQWIRSANGRYVLIYDSLPLSPPGNKNLVLGEDPSTSPDPLWVSTNKQQPDGWCWMQDDGLVMYAWDPFRQVIYHANTGDNRGGYMQVEDDGTLRMYQADRKPVPAPRDWSVPLPRVGNPAKPS